ncbi:kinesin-like protein KIF19 isoform X2 [Centruroides sculpturatus]|uniref:kinesin-like protein KIF19 isoform X2 n=1 Tax=Centruroides sculpturatus TaxID=218467 RepID=UPI000C6E7E2C|nr:kinesin-like protein KIF19 isoform X2 [Centruroides sculpturatus]
MATKRKPSPAKQQRLTVVLRIRPIFSHEINNGAGHIAHKVDEKMVVLMDPHAGDATDILRAKRIQDKKYLFDWAFDDKVTQELVYEKTTRELVESVLDGYNGTVFAYGATGSGKTYTMVGTSEDPGIMVFALQDLFYYLENDRNKNTYEVAMSYLEIYNENIRDLLVPNSGHLELREDSKGNHQVVGLSEVLINNSEEVMEYLTKGNRQRTQEPTGANETSSRSHALLVVQVTKKSQVHDMAQEIKTGKLYMVDLAGSERASQTQNTGKRLVEGAHINKSLLALGNCINALADRSGPRYVNFRDSKLTRLLKEPLSGNCRTVMIAHISPASIHYEESRNTLLYADRAKNISNKVRSNVNDVTYHVAQYKTIISELRQEIQRLQTKIEKQEIKRTRDTNSTTKDEVKKLSDDEMKKLKEDLVSSFTRQMEVRKHMMDIDNNLLALGVEFDKLGMVLNEWETEKAKGELIENSEIENSDNKRNANQQPQYVTQAWEDIQYVRQEHDRFIELREKAEKEFMNCKERTYRLTESLPEKANCEEQRELLILLTRVHKLEIEKMEMQADQLLREHELRQKDLMILRYDRQRQLCDEIITKQRALIDAMSEGKSKHVSNQVQTNHELKELYRIYQQELQELNSGRDSVAKNLENNFFKNNYLGRRSLGSSESMMELSHLDNISRKSNNYPPFTEYQTDDRLFALSSRPFSDNDHRSDSHLSLQSHFSSVPASPTSKLPPINRKETSNIAVVAAKRKSQQTDKNKQDISGMNRYFTCKRSTREKPVTKSPNSVYIKKILNVNKKNRGLNETFQRNGVLPALRKNSPKQEEEEDRRSNIEITEKLRSPTKTRPKTMEERVGVR